MGLIVTLTGPSGSGKSSIVEALLKDSHYQLVLSNTTRAKRPMDLRGEYTYLSDKDYDAISAQDGWLLKAGIATGSRYGTRKQDLDSAIANDKYNLMVLVPHVLPTLRDYVLSHGGRILHLWLGSPEDERRQRMANRGGETQENIGKRVTGEILWRQYLDDQQIPYTPFNNPDGKLDETIAKIRATIERNTA